MKTKILLTGASGFIGSELLEELKSKYDVTPLSSSSDKNGLIKLNLLDSLACEAFFKGKEYDIIIHTAAIAHGKNKVNNMPVGEANIMMTRNLLNNLNIQQAKFVFLSSVAVYDSNYKSELITNLTPAHPVTEYGKSKLKCELLIEQKQPENYWILRLVPVFTETELIDVRKRIVLPFIDKPFLTKQAREYSLVKLHSVTQAILKVVEDKNDGYHTLIVKDEKEYSQNEIFHFFDFSSKPLLIDQRWIDSILIFLDKIPSKKVSYLKSILFKLFYSNLYKNI